MNILHIKKHLAQVPVRKQLAEVGGEHVAGARIFALLGGVSALRGYQLPARGWLIFGNRGPLLGNLQMRACERCRVL